MSAKLSKIEEWEGLARKAKFRPSTMAALCSTSLRQLERHFRVAFDKTPGEWTRELRWRLARAYLSEGWSNKAVVDELGFSDAPHLCREFKRVCGKSPQDFGPSYRS